MKNSNNVKKMNLISIVPIWLLRLTVKLKYDGYVLIENTAGIESALSLTPGKGLWMSTSKFVPKFFSEQPSRAYNIENSVCDVPDNISTCSCIQG